MMKMWIFSQPDVFGLGEGGDFHHPPRWIDTKHTLQIYEKLSYEALNRHFCQTRVMGSKFYTP
jgi:hypothetical protein